MNTIIYNNIFANIIIKIQQIKLQTNSFSLIQTCLIEIFNRQLNMAPYIENTLLLQTH